MNLRQVQKGAEHAFVLESEAATEALTQSKSATSLCDFLPPRVIALNADSTGHVTTAGRELPANDADFQLKSEPSKSDETPHEDTHSKSVTSLCDFLPPHVFAVNGHGTGARRIDDELHQANHDLGTRSKSESSLCDFLPPHVRALNEGAFSKITAANGSGAKAPLDDSIAEVFAMAPIGDLFSQGVPAQTTMGSCPRAGQGTTFPSQQGRRQSDAKDDCSECSSEASLCDFLSPRVMAYNHCNTQFASDEECESENGIGASSEASLCDFLPARVVALNHGCHYVESDDDNGSKQPKASQTGQQHTASSDDEMSSRVEVDEPSPRVCTKSGPATRGIEVEHAGFLVALTLASMCDFMPPHVLALNAADTGCPTAASRMAALLQHHLQHDGMQIRNNAEGNAGQQCRTPSCSLRATDEDRNRGFASSSSSSDCEDSRPQQGRIRQALSRASFSKPLGAIRQSLASRTWRRRSTGQVEELQFDQEFDQNDMRVLNLPATLPGRDREITTTISVDAFRKEIIYPRRVLSKTTTLTFSTSRATDDINNPQDGCAVCLEHFSCGDELRVFPCTHRFHTSCIDVWLVENRLCPVCRNDPLLAQTCTLASR